MLWEVWSGEPFWSLGANCRPGLIYAYGFGLSWLRHDTFGLTCELSLNCVTSPARGSSIELQTYLKWEERRKKLVKLFTARDLGHFWQCWQNSENSHNNSLIKSLPAVVLAEISGSLVENEKQVLRSHLYIVCNAEWVFSYNNNFENGEKKVELKLR